jgi:hypothetical protein
VKVDDVANHSTNLNHLKEKKRLGFEKKKKPIAVDKAN